MSASQIPAPAPRRSVPFVTAIVAVAFTVGALAGLGLPRVLGATSRATGASGPVIAGAAKSLDVAENNMSDAAYQASYGSGAAKSLDVAENNMSDAAYQASYGSGAAKSASAASQKPFHLEKTCVVVSKVKNQCTVTSSTFGAIPVGTLITYDTSAGPTAFVATIAVKNGSATGQCNILAAIGDAAKAGACRFESGTGRLTQFHLAVAVTRSTTADWNPWFWDGTYWFGGGD
jgi:hypothetical protein